MEFCVAHFKSNKEINLWNGGVNVELSNYYALSEVIKLQSYHVLNMKKQYHKETFHHFHYYFPSLQHLST